VVTHSGSPGAVRAAGRLNHPRPAVVEARVDGTPVRGQPPAGCVAEGGVARDRSLVDGGADRTALLRGRAAVRGERRCLSRRDV
jgi:hypothetical protein